MKKALLIMLAVLFSAAAADAALKSDLSPKLPRKIKLDKKQSLVLDKNTHIVLAPKSTPTARFAAAELARFLSRALGCTIPVVSAPKAQGVAIAVGDSPYAKALGINTASFDRDGFAVKSGKNMIVIAGRDSGSGDPALKRDNYFEHATLFGAYDFLERFCGVRFYFPGKFGEVVPRAASISVNAMDIYDRPDHFQRRSHEFSNKWFDTENAKGGPVLQDYRRRAQTFYVPCCHSLENSGYYRRFAKTHPEYFAKAPNGQIYPADHWSVGSGCYLSEGYRKEIFLDAVSWFKGEHPSKRGIMGGSDRKPSPGFRWPVVTAQPGFFSIMPGDHHRRCLCDKCKAYMAKHGENEYVWDMVADIAERVRKEGIKGKITAMAYARYTEVPKRKLPSNMEVMVAVTGPWAERDANLRKTGDERIRSWTKALGKKVWLWTYPSKLNANSNPGIPQMAPRTIGKYFKRQAPYTFGAFYESESDQWIFNYLNTYVYFRQAWDNSVDIDALVDEHHKVMFGKAAPVMNQFYNALEDIWMNKMLGKIQETELGPVIVPPTLHDVWEKIYSPAQLKALEQLLDKAEKAVSGETLGRVKFIREKFLDSLKQASQKYFREKEALAGWNYYVKPLGANEKITVDGKLDDSGWKKCEPTFMLPVTGDICEVKTPVRVRIGKEHLYFAFECMEPRMDEINTERMEKDHKDLWMDSVVEFFLNPSGDGKEYYQFIVNSKGVYADLHNLRMGNSSQVNGKWNSNIKVAASVLKDRFIVEAALPLKDLKRFDAKKFRANFCRHRSLKKGRVASRYYTWSPNHIGYHEAENYGRLLFEKTPDGNMIKNGDFEKPYRLTWSVNTHDPAKGPVFDESTFITAGRSAKLDCRDGKFRWIYQGLPLKANTTYAVSFYLKMENVKPTAAHGGFQILLGDNNNNYVPQVPYTGSMPWTRQGFFWKTGKDGGKVIPGRSRCIRFGLRNAKGIVWIDNVKFSEVPQK